MIVVAIVGILAAIAIPKFADLVRKANEGVTKGNLGAIRSAIIIYYSSQSGSYPNPVIDGPTPLSGSLGYILTMNNGEFLSKMPPCYTPPYHTSTLWVTILVSSPNELSGIAGAWAYQTPSSTLLTDSRPFGDLWVNCTHTDSFTTSWGNY